jgi:phage-related protein
MAIAHTEIKTTLEIKLGSGTPLNMQTLADAIQKSYPKDPNIIPLGISVPGICLTQCKTFGEVNAEESTIDAATRLYNAGLQAIYQPIWTALYAAYSALKRLGLAVIDLTIPYFGLQLTDIFDPNFYCKLFDIVKKLWDKAQDFLKNIFKSLSIPWPIFKGFDSIEEKIKYVVRSLVASLWDELLKKINLIKDLIQTGLKILDAITPPYKPKWSLIWQTAIDQFLKTILDYLKKPPSLQQIYDALVAFAKKVLNKLVVTAEDILSILKRFKLPVFGNPLDWLGDFFKRFINPELSLARVLNDIKLWIKNFIANIILKFLDAVMVILKFLGITFKLPTLKFPITLCVIKVTPTTA